jgi:hypothetical protein
MVRADLQGGSPGPAAARPGWHLRGKARRRKSRSALNDSVVDVTMFQELVRNAEDAGAFEVTLDWDRRRGGV